MNPQIFGLRVASGIFGLVCLVHLLRLVTRVDLLVGGREVPLWMNAVGVVLSAFLSVWMWRLSAQPSR
jgi:hypothetical protein